MMDGTGTGWRALHIFLRDPIKLEAFLLQEVAPAVAALGDARRGWFFIRYWEEGLHLRLRVLDLPAAVFDELKVRLSRRAAEYLAQGGTPIPDLPTDHPDGCVVEFAYAPEYERYGGVHAMELNEELFELSSEVAVAVVSTTAKSLPTRLALARDLMYVTGLAVHRPGPALERFFTDYASFWASYLGGQGTPTVPQATAKLRASLASRRQAVTADQARPDVFGRWHGAVYRLVNALNKLAEQGQLHIQGNGTPADLDPSAVATLSNIVGSQMHMLNNRLGILPEQEYLLASLLARAAVPEGADLTEAM